MTVVLKGKREKGKISKMRKPTDKIDTFFGKKARSSQQLKDAADFGLQGKASIAAKALSEFESTPHSVEPLDLCQLYETEFDAPSC